MFIVESCMMMIHGDILVGRIWDERGHGLTWFLAPVRGTQCRFVDEGFIGE